MTAGCKRRTRRISVNNRIAEKNKRSFSRKKSRCDRDKNKNGKARNSAAYRGNDCRNSGRPA